VTAAEQRRESIMEILSVRRKTSVRELMEKFGVCRQTIVNDLEAVTAYAQFYTVPGNGGGIFACEGWHYKPERLTARMQKAVEDAINGLPPDISALQELLDAFGRKS
jgi:predicted DNA-binding transcriptional regulator YafY